MSGQIDNPFEDEAVATATARVQAALRTLLTPNRFAIVLIALIYGAGNVLIPQTLSSSMGFPVMFAFFFIGALATEIGVLAVGVAFTSGSIIKTFTLNLLLMVLRCASYVCGLQIADSGDMPKEAALFLFGIGIGAFLLTMVCMLVIRWFCQIRIEHQSVAILKSPQSLTEQSFSIRYLMLTTAAIALAICIVRWTIPQRSQDIPPGIFEIACVCTIEAAESIFLVLACVQLVMSRSIRVQVWAFVVIAAFMLLFPFLNAALVQFFTRELLYEYYYIAYPYIAGLAFFSILTLSILRLVGYRLASVDRSVNSKRGRIRNAA